MSHSALVGVERAPSRAPGHDSASLGPSDSTDSGSDLIGAELAGSGDPSMPVDVALGDEGRHPGAAVEAMDGRSDSDASGTGERGSAAGDGSRRDGDDLLPDRIDVLDAQYDADELAVLPELTAEEEDEIADLDAFAESDEAQPEDEPVSNDRPGRRTAG